MGKQQSKKAISFGLYLINRDVNKADHIKFTLQTTSAFTHQGRGKFKTPVHRIGYRPSSDDSKGVDAQLVTARFLSLLYSGVN